LTWRGDSNPSLDARIPGPLQVRQITYASDSIGTPGPVDDSHAAYAPIMDREREGGRGRGREKQQFNNYKITILIVPFCLSIVSFTLHGSETGFEQKSNTVDQKPNPCLMTISLAIFERSKQGTHRCFQRATFPKTSTLSFRVLWNTRSKPIFSFFFFFLFSAVILFQIIYFLLWNTVYT